MGFWGFLGSKYFKHKILNDIEVFIGCWGAWARNEQTTSDHPFHNTSITGGAIISYK